MYTHFHKVLSRLNHLQNNNFVQVYVTKLCTFEKFGTGMGDDLHFHS